MASLLLSERAPPDWGLYPEPVTMGTGGAFQQRMLKVGTAQELAPPPTGTLSSLQR
jgi:hypothetical protein